MTEDVLFICVKCGLELRVKKPGEGGLLPDKVDAASAEHCLDIGGHDWRRRTPVVIVSSARSNSKDVPPIGVNDGGEFMKDGGGSCQHSGIRFTRV